MMDKTNHCRYLLIGALSICLLLFSVIGLHKGGANGESWALLIYEFTKELSYAGIVAVIIIYSVELFTARNQLKIATKITEEIRQDTFSALYHRRLTNEVVDEVEKTIFQSNVFRTKHELTYELSPLETDGSSEQMISCNLYSHYYLENITDRTIKHTVSGYIETPHDARYASHCKIYDVVINQESVLTTPIIYAGKQITFEHDISMKAREKVEVCFKASLIKNGFDVETWASRILSDGITLTVILSGVSKSVDAIAQHPEKLTLMYKTQNVYKWELRYPMLPFQSLVFWWK